jgi:MFS family permease
MNRNLNLLLSGQLVSQVGDKFHMLAVAFLVLKTTGSPAKMGLILFCSVFPSMLLGLVSGTFIDRYNRKTIIIGADVARGLVVSGLALCYLLDVLTFPVLLLAQVILSVCTAFFDPAIPAIIPQIVKPDQLTRTNSQAQFISGLATVVGPTLGGIMVAWGGYLPVFLINAGSYLISAGFECLIKIPPLKRRVHAKTEFLDDIRQGCGYVYIRNHLMVILLMVGVIHFFVGCIEVVIPVLATSLVGDGARNIGYLQTFFGTGMIMTAFLLSFINITGREARFLFGGVFCIGLLLLITSLICLSGARGILAFMLLFCLMGGAIIIAGTSFRSILQKEVQEDMMGRIFGFAAAVGNISIPLATLIYGILMSYMSHGSLMAISGVVLLPISLVAYHIFSQTNQRPATNQSNKFEFSKKTD